MKNRIVIYTAIFGGYDGLLPQRHIAGVDYVCFTDRQLRASPWQVRVVAPRYDDPVRSAKEFKILPHLFFPEYDVSVWIDGNFLVVGNVPEFVEAVLTTAPMAAFNHGRTLNDENNCIYREYEWILRLGNESGNFKDDPEIMRRQIERYREEGYPEENGMINGGVLVRRHHNAEVKMAMEHWWREIVNGSRRDQLSFNYVAWKDSFGFYLIDDNIRCNRWFYMIGIHRKSYRMKLFRYRLRRLFGLVRYH